MPEREGLLRLAVAAKEWSEDVRLGEGRQAMARTVARFSRELAQGERVAAADMDTLQLMTCHLYRHLQPDVATVAACPFGRCDAAACAGRDFWRHAVPPAAPLLE